MLLVIVAGHIDLSVGSVAGFIGALAAVLMVDYDMLGHLPPASSASSSARPSGRRRATGSPITASLASSSRWPACWCSRACRWRCWAASRVGPFPAEFQLLQRRLHPRRLRPHHALGGAAAHHHAGDRHPDRRAPCSTSTCGPARSREKHGYEGRALRAVRRQERGHRGAGAVLRLHDGVLQGPAQRADRDARPDRLLRLPHQEDDARPPHLRHGRQPQGREPFGHQDRPADLLRLRHHGRAGGAGRPDLRRPAQHRDAQGRAGLRARRHRRRASSAAPRGRAASGRWRAR